MSSVSPPNPPQREKRKRKWDQPGDVSSISSTISLPGTAYVSSSITPSPNLTPSSSFTSNLDPVISSVQKNAAAVARKINEALANKGLISKPSSLPPKPQEAIAIAFREVVINDADPAVRYKLTKRQTQEDIQQKTGAIVITRGRYQSPNDAVSPVGEKPLYLHISPANDIFTSEAQKKALDDACSLIEQILNSNQKINSENSNQNINMLSNESNLSSTIEGGFYETIYPNFEFDSSFDFEEKVKGPNNQYLHHIFNETKSVVVVKGNKVNGYNSSDKEAFHLIISSPNSPSLENAKILIRNLLDTIHAEYLQSKYNEQSYSTVSPSPLPATPATYSPLTTSSMSLSFDPCNPQSFTPSYPSLPSSFPPSSLPSSSNPSSFPPHSLLNSNSTPPFIAHSLPTTSASSPSPSPSPSSSWLPYPVLIPSIVPSSPFQKFSSPHVSPLLSSSVSMASYGGLYSEVNAKSKGIKSNITNIDPVSHSSMTISKISSPPISTSPSTLLHTIPTSPSPFSPSPLSPSIKKSDTHQLQKKVQRRKFQEFVEQTSSSSSSSSSSPSSSSLSLSLSQKPSMSYSMTSQHGIGRTEEISRKHVTAIPPVPKFTTGNGSQTSSLGSDMTTDSLSIPKPPGTGDSMQDHVNNTGFKLVNYDDVEEKGKGFSSIRPFWA